MVTNKLYHPDINVVDGLWKSVGKVGFFSFFFNDVTHSGTQQTKDTSKRVAKKEGRKEGASFLRVTEKG